MKNTIIQIGSVVLVVLALFAVIYFPYTWIYDKAVFDTLKKIECIKELGE